MEFEEMKVIWNSDNQEKLYAINEDALYSYIKRKGHSVNRTLEIIEFLMMVVNLGVGIVLFVDMVRGNGQLYEYILPAMYLAYTIYFFIRRLTRRQEAARFEETMVGEVDKALWQIDYLIKQSQGLVVWYLVPIMLVAAVTLFFSASNPLWALAVLVVLVPAAYFGGRKEIVKCYLPKKRELEALRAKLVEPVAP